MCPDVAVEKVCPNDGAPMRRVTWEERAKAAERDRDQYALQLREYLDRLTDNGDHQKALERLDELLTDEADDLGAPDTER